MNVLEICANVLHEIGEAHIPSSLINNQDEGAIQMLALLNAVGRELVKENFDGLKRTYELTTTTAQSLYDLPDDFGHFKSSGKTDKYTKLGNKLSFLEPAAETLAITYYANNICISQNGADQRPRFADDLDIPLFEADLFAAGFKWKFKQAKGLDFGIDFEQYRAALTLLLFQESNADTINL